MFWPPVASVKVEGAQDLVWRLKGREFKDVNNALRYEAGTIAKGMVPVIQGLVRQSRAPQAPAFIPAVGVKRDRVPVVMVGRNSPKFSTPFAKRRKRGADGALSGADPLRRRGSMAHGIFYGPLGGHKATAVHENYYQIPRDQSGGPLRFLKPGNIAYDKAARLYAEAFADVLTRLGWTVIDRRNGGVGLG